MRKIVASLLLMLIAPGLWSQPLHVKLTHSVIIDTDCAIDDMRAIGLLLSLPHITVKAIMVSNGSLPPGEGALKVKSLLHEFHRDSIPVMRGKELSTINPAWREFNRQIKWGADDKAYSGNNSTLQDIARIVNTSTEPISFVCLGPLTNVAQLIKNNSNVTAGIEEIIWFNESVSPLKGFNYECDKKAAEMLFASKIKINVISNPGNEKAVFDTSLYNICASSNTLLANNLLQVHKQPLVFEKLKLNHFKLWDELTVLFLTNPELFTIEPLKDNNNIRCNISYSGRAVKEVLEDMIRGKYKAGEYVAFYGFPVKREIYTYDVRQMMDSAISRYGMDEWKACVMTDEFHGHLGVFSIVGAKMGIRARDYFGIGSDLLNVVSFAGTKPPYSCLNDGIQVSTGATLGQGTIKVHNDTVSKPSAIFTYKGQSIKITLKDEYLASVEADIKKGIAQYGLDDENYWTLIRQNALNYWLEWDRNKIFDIEEIKN
jgi:inosine-uridine nucleoside N-ribohydrolase/formylmethanofuran dehydrogenase subunit E